MPSTSVVATWPDVKVSGAPLSGAIKTRLLEAEVESTYNRTDICLLSFDIDANTEIPSTIEIGSPLELAIRTSDRSEGITVFKGEITALEFDAVEDRSVFVVQAENSFHRLFRGDRVRTFLNMTVSDAVKKIAGAAGLPSGKVDSTVGVIPFQMQQAVSDGAWILERAAEVGYHTGVKDGKFYFARVGAGGDSGVELAHGENLLGFTCRVTGNAFVTEASVLTWDQKQKKEVVGTATSYRGEKDQKVASAFPQPPPLVLPRTGHGSAAEVGAAAQAAMDRGSEHQRQAEGRCFGDARIAVDKIVTIAGANERFDGRYTVSHVRHRFTADDGFLTEFSCRGAVDQSLTALVSESAAANGATVGDRMPFLGATVGIVTDNSDPDGWGRVKVRLPWLSETETTDWLRIAFPGGGGKSHHGWYLLPEVDDEVLVLFEHGDARRGYVLGGLHNGKDKPSYTNDKVLAGHGEVNQHAFRMKSGAHLLFDESKDGEKVELIGKNGKGFHFKFHDTDGAVLTTPNGEKLTVTNNGDISILAPKTNILVEAAKGELTLKAMKDITIQSATGKVAIKAAAGDVTLDAMNVKANAQASAEIKGTGTAALQSGGQTTVKGAMVMIN